MFETAVVHARTGDRRFGFLSLSLAVHTAAVDVGDEEALRSFLEQFRAEGWPPIKGVVHAAGTIYVDGQLRIFGALVAQGGVTGRGVLEVWYNDDLHRGFIQGLPVVFPLKGTWREWGS